MSAQRNTLRDRLLFGCALAVAASALGACGAEGSLQRPGPFFGESAKRQYQSDRAAGRTSGASDIDAAAPRGTTAAGSANNDDNAPRTTRDIQDPAQKLTPLSAAPVDGPPNPLGAPVSTRPPG